MRRKFLSMLTVVMILFMAVGCGGGGTATADNSPNKETQLSVSFKLSEDSAGVVQQAEKKDVKSVRVSIFKDTTFYLESVPMTQNTVTEDWSIGVNLDNSLAPFGVVVIAMDSVDESGKVVFKTEEGTVIEDLTANVPVTLEEVLEEETSSTNLPSVKSITHIDNGDTVNIRFVINNAVRYELSSGNSIKVKNVTNIGTFEPSSGDMSFSLNDTVINAVYHKAQFEIDDNRDLNLKIKLTDNNGNTKESVFTISQNVLTSSILTLNFPPLIKINVEEQLIPGNTYKITATVTDDDSTSWTYAWGKIRGAKALASDASNPNELEIESISTTEEQYPLCFALTVTDDEGASSSLDYCIKNAEDGYVGVKKTGRTKSYAEDGTEVTDGSVQDDGFYQKGLTPQYTRDAVAQTVTDHVTGLVWQDDEDVKTVDLNWTDAKAYCESKDNGNGWYLPSIQELNSILDYSNVNFIDGEFENFIALTFTSPTQYWSSTTMYYDNNKAWNIPFNAGTQYYTPKSNQSWVRCVRVIGK